MKKSLSPVPIFFLGQKYVSIPSQKKWDRAESIPVGKIFILNRQ